jgi:hypothetical protein
MNYFDPDMSKSTNTVVYFDWKTVIYIYVCGQCPTQYICTKSWSVTWGSFTPRASTNKTDCYYINEILLKVVLDIITHPPFNLLQTLVTHLFQTHGRKHIQWFHQILDR